jgi:branched-chain amino acid transport system permease protein
MMVGQQLMNGLVSGSVYALFALGFTLIFGTHQILNLAHAGVFMAGAFVAYYAVLAGVPLWAASVLAMAAAGVLSYLLDLTAFRRLRLRGQIEFSALISSIGANLVMTSVAQGISHTKVVSFPFGTFPNQFFHVFGLRIALLQIVIIIVVAILLAALIYYLHYTSFGRQVRAVAGNERAAMLLGVNPDFVFFQTFFISGALAGMAGVLIGLLFNAIHFLMGEPYMLRAFVVVVLGGLGSIPGAVVAGLLLGMMQTLTVAYLPSGLSDTIIYALLFVILLLKPSGLFGKQSVSIGVSRQ